MMVKKRYMAFSLTVVLGLIALFLVMVALLPLLNLNNLPLKLSQFQRPSSGWSLHWAR